MAKLILLIKKDKRSEKRGVISVLKQGRRRRVNSSSSVSSIGSAVRPRIKVFEKKWIFYFYIAMDWEWL